MGWHAIKIMTAFNEPASIKDHDFNHQRRKQ
jgi:hypothetical protein